MSAPPLRVLVASGDPRFRRLAGVVLTRAGHEVHTMTARPWRVERVLELRPPDVVVLEADGELARRLEDHPGGGPALVRVADPFGPVDELVRRVEAAAVARPRLRVVSGGR